MSSSKTIGETSFYTATEVANRLKINHQVLLRKLQTGEMAGYKLGRDWRITDGQVWEWLEKHSNRNRKLSEKDKIIKNFFVNGRLKEIPAQRKRRKIVLEYILRDFQSDRVYSEKEVNEVIKKYHPDFCTIRREFIIFKMMLREKGIYKTNSAYIPSPGRIPEVIT